MRIYAAIGWLLAVFSLLPDAVRSMESYDQFRRRIMTTFQLAVDARDIPTVLSMLERGEDINQTTSEAGYTAVFFLFDQVALRDQHANSALEMLQVLLDHGLRVNHRSERGDTPLSFAVGANDLPCVRLLLEHGARPDLRDEDGVAVWQGNMTTAMAELLVSHMPNPTHHDLDTALAWNCKTATISFYRRLQRIPDWLFILIWLVGVGFTFLRIRLGLPAISPPEGAVLDSRQVNPPQEADIHDPTIWQTSTATDVPHLRAKIVSEPKTIPGLGERASRDLLRLRRILLLSGAGWIAVFIPFTCDPFLVRGGLVETVWLAGSCLINFAAIAAWWPRRLSGIRGRGIFGGVAGLCGMAFCLRWGVDCMQIQSLPLIALFAGQFVLQATFAGVSLWLGGLGDRTGRTGGRPRRRRTRANPIDTSGAEPLSQVAPGWDLASQRRSSHKVDPTDKPTTGNRSDSGSTGPTPA